jgi:hypothetical protein
MDPTRSEKLSKLTSLEKSTAKTTDRHTVITETNIIRHFEVLQLAKRRKEDLFVVYITPELQ